MTRKIIKLFEGDTIPEGAILISSEDEKCGRKWVGDTYKGIWPLGDYYGVYETVTRKVFYFEINETLPSGD